MQRSLISVWADRCSGVSRRAADCVRTLALSKTNVNSFICESAVTQRLRYWGFLQLSHKENRENKFEFLIRVAKQQ